MATLVKLDGCAHYNSTTDLQKKWNTVNTGFSFSAQNPRRPYIGHLRVGSGWTQECGEYLIAESNTVIIGAAFRLNYALTSGQHAGLYMVKTRRNVRQTYLSVYYGGKLRVGKNYPGFSAGIIQTETTGSIIVGQWHYIEFKIQLGGTGVGKYLVAVDGVTKLTGTTNTLYTGTDTICSYVCLLGGQRLIDYTDIYIKTSNNNEGDFLGDCRVDTLYPQSDHIVELSPSQGTTNYENVNSRYVNTDTYYNYGKAAVKDEYRFSTLAQLGDSTVHGVAVTIAGRVSDVGVRRITGVSGGETHNYFKSAIDTEYTFYQYCYDKFSSIYSQDWTFDLVNQQTFGVYISA